MSLIKYPIKNYQFTLIMVLMIVVVGISTILSMPRAEDPSMKPAQFPVVVIYPGTTPKDMEQLVVKPLEERFYGLDNIKRLKTSVFNSLAVLYVEYEHGVSYNDKYQEVIREVAASRTELPQDIYSMEVMQVDPSGVNILQIGLVSETASNKKMKELSDNLKQELEKIIALKDVTVHGLAEQLVRIDLQQDRMAKAGVTLNQLVQAVQSESVNIPGGSIFAGGQTYSIKTTGNYQSIEEIKNTIVNSVEGKNVLLRDVADVYQDFSAPTHITRLNGYKSLFVTAAQKENKNISAVQEEYRPVLETFKESLPSNVDMVVNFDQADNVNHRLAGLGKDFLIAIGLVLLTLLPLGTRASLVVMIAIPLSLAIGVVILSVFGFSLNQLSIVGFVVALGLVVDDSIVVVENVERWMREGYSRLDAAVKGAEQIAVAVVGCTATLCIAFLPLMFLPEVSGDFIRSLPVAVIGSVIASMIIALLVVPFLSSRLLKPHHHPEGNIILRTFQKVIHSTYAVLLDKALKRPVFSLLLALLVFAGSLTLIPVLGFSLFPASEKPQFVVQVQTPPQANIYYTDSITKKIEKQLDSIGLVQYYSANVGKGNPRIYYNTEQANEKQNFSEIFVQLHNSVKPNQKLELIDSLRDIWNHYLGAKIQVKNFEQGVPIIAPVEVRIFGENLDSLKVLAARAEKVVKETEGAIYVNNPLKNEMTDIRILINKEKALAVGVPSTTIDRTVRMALAGVDIGTYTNPDADNDDYKIRLSVPRKAYPDLSVLDYLMVENIQGKAIALNQLATVQLEASPSEIRHLNKERTVSVSAFIGSGYSVDKVIKSVEEKLQNMEMPAGYSFKMAGEVESREESFGGFGTIIMITVFLFIAVLILEFKTLKSTLIVLSVIPLGIVGAVLALLVTGNTLSFVATIGLVALAGIEVKNTILLVDFTNQLRREGMGLNEAIEKAGEMRFLPIILTTLTAIGGLLPIAWSSNPLISPLAIVMIGGLISSTLLSRIVTPVVYKLIPPKI